jgi:hypothetical protein
MTDKSCVRTIYREAGFSCRLLLYIESGSALRAELPLE